MFSITTTVSSIIKPIATAKPPNDIRFSVSPLIRRKPKLIIRLSGIDNAAMRAARTLFKNTSNTNTLIAPPMSIASRTLSMAVRTS